MDHDEEPGQGTQAQEDEPLLAGRVIRILDQDRGLVTESGLRFLEADPVPAPIAGRLGRIPSEVQLAHGSNVCTMYAWRKFSRVQPNAWHMCCGRGVRRQRGDSTGFQHGPRSCRTNTRGRQLTMCVLCVRPAPA